jgi:DNA-binding transcriptional ArsR family regulator
VDPLPPAALKLIADRFKLLSSPTRLAILQLVCERERTVGELVEETGFKQANVSKQLSMLDRGGLVRRRVDGTHVYYTMADEALPKLCGIMQESLMNRQGELLGILKPRD